MSEITIPSQFILGLLDEIGRTRALTDSETDIIEEIVLQDEVPFLWNEQLHKDLIRAARSFGGISRFARKHNITLGMAYAKHHRIRRRKGCKLAPGKQEG